MDKQYWWWRWCKYLAWGFTILWTILCAIVTLIFVVRFDMLRNAQNNDASPQEATKCPATLIDVSDQNATSYYGSQKALTNYLETVPTSTLNTNGGFAFRESVSRWLMSIFIGFLLSLFVWQPLFDLILQIIKVCRFDPDEVNESYYFSNTKLLLTQKERKELIQAGANIGADDDADKESSENHDDADSQQGKKEDVVGKTNLSQNVLEELDKQMTIEMLRTQVELLDRDPND